MDMDKDMDKDMDMDMGYYYYGGYYYGGYYYMDFDDCPEEYKGTLKHEDQKKLLRMQCSKCMPLMMAAQMESFSGDCGAGALTAFKEECPAEEFDEMGLPGMTTCDDNGCVEGE